MPVPHQEGSLKTRQRLPGHSVALAIGAAALVLSAVGAAMNATAFWAGYLVALEFWLGLSLGSLGVALLHSITGGGWGHSIARDLRAATATLIVGVIAMVPLWWAASVLYPGATPERSGVLNSHQQQYFESHWQILRIVIYLAVWGGLAAWIVACYRRQNLPSPRKAALGLLLVWMATTFAVVDGIMGLMPDWPSTLFPMMAIVGFGVIALALMIVLKSVHLGDAQNEAVRRQSHDLGNMLQAFNLVWVYLAFSQYLIIWSGDLPYEVRWYIERQGGWGLGIPVLLIAFHFAVPFALLLSRPLKRNPRKLARVAALLLAVHLAALSWEILPSIETSRGWAALLAVTNALVIGVLWLGGFSAVRHRLPDHSANAESAITEPAAQVTEGSA